jgi:hypothetical protein
MVNAAGCAGTNEVSSWVCAKAHSDHTTQAMTAGESGWTTSA